MVNDVAPVRRRSLKTRQENSAEDRLENSAETSRDARGRTRRRTRQEKLGERPRREMLAKTCSSKR